MVGVSASRQSRKPWRAALCDLLCLCSVWGFYSLPGIQQDGANEFREAPSGMWQCWLRLPGHPQGIWSFWKQWPQLISLFRGGSDFPQCCGNLLSLRRAAQRAVLVYTDSSFFVRASVKDLLNLWEQETIWKWVPSPIPFTLNARWKFWSEVFLLSILKASEDSLSQGPLLFTVFLF